MTDQSVRALERRAAATGAVEDETADRLAKLRAGLLSPEMLKLAAFCGDPAAQAAVGLPCSIDCADRRSRTKSFTILDWKDTDPLRTWAYRLTFWPAPVTMRVLLFGAKEVLRRHPNPVHQHALQLVEKWLDVPGSVSRSDLLSTPEVTTRDTSGQPGPDCWWGGLVSAALWVMDDDDPNMRQGFPGLIEDTAISIAERLGEPYEWVKQFMRQAAVEWALRGSQS